MIALALALMLMGQVTDTSSRPADQDHPWEQAQPVASRLMADVAIKSAEEEIAHLGTRSPLLEKLMQTARAAYEEGRYDDAIGIARRARVSAGHRGREAARTTTPSEPLLESMYEALERLVAAESRQIADPRVVTARELVTASEASFAAHNVTQADNLARKAIAMLSTLPASSSARDTMIVKVDLNAATPVEILRAPGMTREMVKNLLWFRSHIGPLESLNEIRFVPGFDSRYIPIAARYFTVIAASTAGAGRR